MTGFDIPARLRQIAEPGCRGVMGYSAARDIRLAADRIETLEAEVDRLTVDNQRLGSRFTGDDGIDLTDTEATALAWRVCCEAVAALVDAGRLDWEDFPNLTETAWGKVAAAIDSTVVDSIRFTADSYDRAHGLDSRRLHGEATR